jgi:DNA repair protein RadC
VSKKIENQKTEDAHPSSIKDWPEDERPRERLIKYGGDKLSDAHLLGILIGSGDPQSRRNAIDLSREILKAFGDFNQIDAASVNELCRVKGIGLAKAAQIKAALELGKRMAAQKIGGRPTLQSSRDFVSYYSPFLKNVKKEVVKAVLLNPGLKLIKDITVSEGSLNASVVHPREVMIPAIKESAACIVMIHNHPSGDPSPSQADIEITHRLAKTGEIIGIKLLDHIIIGEEDYYSFADEGLL